MMAIIAVWQVQCYSCVL